MDHDDKRWVIISRLGLDSRRPRRLRVSASPLDESLIIFGLILGGAMVITCGAMLFFTLFT